jgi:hypothetical protein
MVLEVASKEPARQKLVQHFGDLPAECKLFVNSSKPRGASMIVTAALSFADDKDLSPSARYADDEAGKTAASFAASYGPIIEARIVGQTISVALPADAVRKLVALNLADVWTNVQLVNVQYKLPTNVERKTIGIDISEYDVPVNIPYGMNFGQFRQYIRTGDYDVDPTDYRFSSCKRLSTELLATDIFKAIDELYVIVGQYVAPNEMLRSFLALCRSERVKVAYKMSDKTTDLTALLLNDCKPPQRPTAAAVSAAAATVDDAWPDDTY